MRIWVVAVVVLVVGLVLAFSGVPLNGIEFFAILAVVGLATALLDKRRASRRVRGPDPSTL